jgi:chromatin segregation and condensation protein Rec8/ScpA/Scc1 (kleisin family)
LSNEHTETPKATEEATVASAADGQPINVAGATPEISAGQDGDTLKLVLGEFAGPLDLLLYLIRQEQVSIYDIPIARITDEYLRYLRLMQGMDITMASDFLVMAAQLIEIKSRMLLPRDPTVSEEELQSDDPRRELVERLLEHQKYKAAAEMLWPPQHDLLGRRAEHARLLRARRDAPRAGARVPLRPRTRPHDRDQTHPAPDLRRHHRARRRVKALRLQT